MSTDIHGQAKWDTCWRQACYLAKHIYKNPPGPDGFKTHYPEKMAEVERFWEQWGNAEQNNQAGSGLVARLFKLKAWDPKDPKAPPCPPCLVFRGTDFEDMRGLGFAATIRVQWGVVWWTIDFNKLFDPTIPQKKVWKSHQKHPNIEDYSRKELDAMGFTPINILNEEGSTTAEGATRGTSLNLKLRINADLMAKEEGDWLNNLNQGLGRGSQQYDEAKRFGLKLVKEKISPLADKRLEITGHSLGGGLAAAVCCALDFQFPDVTFHAITFNAAGVHSKTVNPAALSDGVINNFTVDDEILTTLQHYPTKLPFVGAVFSHASRSLGMKAMPLALGTLRSVPGRSPGGDLGEKGSFLPVLFAVKKQSLRPDADSTIPVLTALDSMLQSSSSMTQFGTRFAQWLNERYRTGAEAIASRWGSTIYSLYRDMGGLMMAEIEAEKALLTELFAYAAEYHGMDVVIASYEAANPSGKK